MEIKATYPELNVYVAKRFKQPIWISYVGEKEIKVTYTKRILIKDLKINVNLRFDEVKEDSVTVTYDGAFGLDMIISGALSFFKSQFPELSAGILPEDHHRIRINLNEIEKAKPLVQNVTLHDITATEEGLRILFSLKP